MNPHGCRFLSLVVGALAAASLAGCGGGNANMMPVTGKVKFADGTIPKGEIAVVTFTPDRLGPAVKSNGASGDIQADGSFRLKTGQEDGALVGSYKVTFRVLQSYAGNKSLIAKKYDVPETTDITAEVKAGDKNHFEWTLDKPSK